MNTSKNKEYSKPRSHYTFSLLGAIIKIIVGFLLLCPFLYDVFFVAQSTQFFTLWDMFQIFGLIIGGPMFILGILGIWAKWTNQVSGTAQMEMDISRIRFAAETQMMHDLMRDIKNPPKGK